jgi:hypothetical protein
MPSKRRPISFPELEPKGRGAILRSAEEVAAEKQLLESQESGMPEIQHAGITETQHAGNRASYPKATYRLSPEALEAIDEAKRILRRRHNIKVSLEEIAEEAILAAYNDLQENQQASMLANKFASKSNQRSGQS